VFGEWLFDVEGAFRMTLKIALLIAALLAPSAALAQPVDPQEYAPFSIDIRCNMMDSNSHQFSKIFSLSGSDNRTTKTNLPILQITDLSENINFGYQEIVRYKNSDKETVYQVSLKNVSDDYLFKNDNSKYFYEMYFSLSSNGKSGGATIGKRKHIFNAGGSGAYIETISDVAVGFCTLKDDVTGEQK
jgi:hypothetical protein